MIVARDQDLLGAKCDGMREEQSRRAPTDARPKTSCGKSFTHRRLETACVWVMVSMMLRGCLASPD
jgi:hypothetical protein